MITNEQLAFIDRLTKTHDFDSVYNRLVAYATRRLQRRAGVRDRDAPQEVANEAFQRLFSEEHIAWVPVELSVEELVHYLADRVDDIVKNRWRSRKRERSVEQFETDRHDRPKEIEDEVESTTYTQDLEDKWFSRAADQDSLLGDLVLQWISDNTSVEGQARALALEKREVYRLRTRARQILKQLADEQETRG